MGHGEYCREIEAYLCRRNEGHLIRIVGRRSLDIIKSRAFKISAIEIENCLQEHPEVAEVAGKRCMAGS